MPCTSCFMAFSCSVSADFWTACFTIQTPGASQKTIHLHEGGRLLESSPQLNHLGGWFFIFQKNKQLTVKIFSGTSNLLLAKSIASSIGMELGKCTVSAFPDGETFVKIE